MKFKVHDLVSVLDDDFEGQIVAIEESDILVESDDGFVLRFRESELVLTVSHPVAQQMKRVSQDVINAKEASKKQTAPKSKSKKSRYIPPMEVDLHIEKLVSSKRGMSNYEILNLQLATAQRQLDFARSKKIQRIVFIHGVGEGVLKEELRYFLRRQENLEFSDGDYQKYGLGATEVYILQKGFTS